MLRQRLIAHDALSSVSLGGLQDDAPTCEACRSAKAGIARQACIPKRVSALVSWEVPNMYGMQPMPDGMCCECGL